MTQVKLNDEQISKAAYLIWIGEGRPAGRDQEHWQMAVEALSAVQPKAKRARKAPTKSRKASPKVSAKKATPKVKAKAKKASK